MNKKYDGLNALVLGAGVSGVWAARLLLSRRCRVTVLDEGKVKFGIRNEELGIRSCWQGALPDEAFDVCVASPAFALGHRWIVECAARGIPVISELELGAHYWCGKILAVTGSKGKSSLVKLCANTLNAAGIAASPAGNYGIPLCQLVLEQSDVNQTKKMWAVTEVSSFQMEHSPTFHPQIAILLNFQPDHLDRHADFAEYRALKMRVFANMDKLAWPHQKGSCAVSRDLALFPSGVDVDPAILERTTCERFGDAPDCDWRYVPSAVRSKHYCEETAPLGSWPIAGAWFDNGVLGLAAAAAVPALLHAGVGARAIEEGFKNFRPLAHRVQTLGTDARGVTWVDDSKATSLTALAAALRMVKKPVRLIAGGVLKENDLTFLKEVLAETTQKVYLIGECAGKMADVWASSVPCEIYGTIECAVSAVAQDAQRDETVLLSPGTASFDQFSSYRERGERFARLARAVAGL